MQDILEAKPKAFKIAECSFKRQEPTCILKYAAQGICPLNTILSQLVPNVDIADSTSKFIIPEEFYTRRIEIDACAKSSDGIVTFVCKSSESIELVPQRLTLAAETRLKLSWNAKQDFQPEKLSVKLNGFTSIGELHFLEASLVIGVNCVRASSKISSIL